MMESVRLLRTQISRLWTQSGDFSWNLAAAATTQGSTFLAAVILTHMLGVEAFGRYVVGQSTVVALGSLFGLGLGFVANALLARHVSADPLRTARIHRFCFTVASISGLAGGLLVSGGFAWIAEHLFHDSHVKTEILLAGIALPFSVVSIYQTGALAGLAAFRPLAATALIGAVSLLAGASVGAFVAGPTGALVGLLFSLSLRAWVGNGILRTRVLALSLTPADFRSTWPEVRGFALPTVLSGLTMMSALWLSNAILTSHTDTRSLGVFSSAFLIKTAVTFVPLQFGSVLLSRLSALSAKGDLSAWRRTHIGVLLTGVGIAAALAVPLALAAPFVMSLFGPGFKEGAQLLRWLMLCAVVESAATLIYYGFPGRGPFWKAALAYSVPKDLVLLGSALFLVRQFGSLGLAWAHSASWAYGLLAVGILNLLDRPHQKLMEAARIQ